MTLDNIWFSYGQKPVFEGLTLTIPDTGITAVSGPSGCGKTTLLRLIKGLETPKSGTISAPPHNMIAFMFQEDRLFSGLTPSEQIKAVLPRGADPLPWLSAVGLQNEADLPTESLSGGMRRRVSLARCMSYAILACAETVCSHSKSLMLLDEPFTGVDSENMRAIFANMRQMNVPTVLSSHDAEVLAMADRVIKL